MAKTFVEQFTDILAEQGAISHDENKALEKIFKESGKSNFVDFLLEEGMADKDEILKALATYYRVASFDAVGYFFEHQLLHMFPKDFLLRNGIIPIESDDNILLVLANNPNDSELLPKIGQHVSYDIRFRVGILQDIIDAVQEFYDKAPTEDTYDQSLFEEHELEKEGRGILLEEEDLQRIRGQEQDEE